MNAQHDRRKRTGPRVFSGSVDKVSVAFLVAAIILVSIFIAITIALASPAPSITSLTSPTHPDINTWYDDHTPAFSWSQEIPFTGSYYDGQGSPHDVAVRGSYAYVANNGSGLRIFDISDPASPTPVGMRDTPGWAMGVAVSGDYAYVADMAAVQILDISDPANPAIVGSYDTLSDANEVAIAGNYLYIAHSGRGLEILDITDPADPALVSDYNTPGQVTDVLVSGGYAYLADWGNGLVIVDVSDPSTPALAGSLASPGAISLARSGTTTFIAAHTSGFQIVDTFDPANPSLVGSHDTADTAIDVAVSGSFAYVADRNGGLLAMDISNPASPAVAGIYNRYAEGVTVSGNLVYVANVNGVSLDIYEQLQGFSYVLDQAADTVPDTTAEGTAATVTLPGTGRGEWYFHVRAVDLSGNWGPASHRSVKIDSAPPALTSLISPTHPDENIWYSSNDPAFSWTQNLNPVSTLDLPGFTQNVAVSGSHAYVTDAGNGLEIVDISNPDFPTLSGAFDTPHYAMGLELSGDLAYVADGSSGLQIINVADPGAPAYAGSVDTWGTARDVALGGNYAYIADGQFGLGIVLLTTPTTPVFLGYFDMDDDAVAVEVRGNYAYVAADNLGGLQIVDISSPSFPTQAGWYDTPGFATDVAVSGNYAYIADGASGLQIIDISNPAVPALAGSLDVSTDARGVKVSGDYAYVADGVHDGTGGVQVIDVSNAAQPELVGSYMTWIGAYGIAVSEDYIFLAETIAGLDTYENIQGYSYVLDTMPDTVPDVVAEGTSRRVSFTDETDGDKYLHVRATHTLGNGGPVSHRRVRIDATYPVTVDDAPALWQKDDFTVTLGCTDPLSGCAATTFTVDGGAPQSGNSVAITTEGDHTIAYYSTDAAGNIETQQTAQARLDKTDPATTDDAPALWQKDDFTVTLGCTDPLSGCAATTFTVDGGAPQSGNSVAITTEGDHTIAYYSTDAAGNGEEEKAVHARLDKSDPVTTDDAPVLWQKDDFTVTLGCTDPLSGCAAISYTIDGGAPQSGGSVAITTEGDHTIAYYSTDAAGNIETQQTAQAKLDKTLPVVSNVIPSGTLGSDSQNIEADLADGGGSGINAASSTITLDGGAPLTNCTRTVTSISCPVTGLTAGDHNIAVSVDDNAGNSGGGFGAFLLVRDYYWTWYDNVGGANWVLMANPVGAPTLTMTLAIGGAPMDLSGYNGGVIGAGQSITPRYTGVMGGPVKACSTTSGKGIMSQRILWGGNSLEEVLGTDSEKLSSHFWWTWYDGTAGFKNWVLVANPNATAVDYSIRIAGVARATGTIPANSYVTPQFPGIMGGPVEVTSTGGDVMASQRVLSNGDTAFNEVPGIPDGELYDHYLWTWYDNVGGRDWVLIANPATNADGSANIDSLYYRISIGNVPVQDGGPIPPGGNVTPTFSGLVSGPVEVSTFSDPGHGTSKRSIASQRVVWGPSFEEVPGYRFTALTNSYHWTWYDESAAGVKNWVLVANTAEPGGTTVHYTVNVAGITRAEGDLAPGARVTPEFPGVMGGPVEVTSTGGSVMSSQRVLWNGFFNEVLGTSLS